jgi:hypothetical protein
MMTGFKDWKIGILFVVLMLTSLACGLMQSAAKNTPLPPFEEKPTATVSNQPAKGVPATTVPENTPTTAPIPGSQPNAYYEGISFYYDPSLAKGVTAHTVEASAPAGDNMPFFAVNPQEFQFDFQGFMVEPATKPQILVFSPKDYEKLMSGGGDPNPVIKELNDFNKLMADHPGDSSGSLPFLPVSNAGQEMHAQLKYIKFQNGSGIRYLTEYGQDVAPLSNKALFYTFQGTTSDGAYFISAQFPVNHPMLAGDEGEALKEKDYQKFMDNFPNYVVDAQKQLNAQKDDSYNPALNMLDAMIASLKVAK